MSSSVRPTIYDPNIERSCTRKRRYSSKRAAKAEARSLSRSPYGPNVAIYACPHCGGWHLARRHR